MRYTLYLGIAFLPLRRLSREREFCDSSQELINKGAAHAPGVAGKNPYSDQ